jgi:hypothetical protein
MGKGDDPPRPFGPAWEGWESYNQFQESVKSDLRFVRSKATNRFLDEVRTSCPSRKLIIPPKSIFWRARLGCEYEEITKADDDVTVTFKEERPYRQDAMKPIRNWQSEGGGWDMGCD